MRANQTRYRDTANLRNTDRYNTGCSVIGVFPKHFCWSTASKFAICQLLTRNVSIQECLNYQFVEVSYIFFQSDTRKDRFCREVFKNLARLTKNFFGLIKIIMFNLLLESQKLFAALSVLHNYFDGPIKLFSDLYIAKFLDIAAKFFPLFPCSLYDNIKS